MAVDGSGRQWTAVDGSGWQWTASGRLVDDSG